MTNEDKYKKYKTRKILRYGMILCSFMVIVLESFALFKVISMYWGCIPFFLSFIFKFFYEKDDFKKDKSKKEKNSK